MSAIKSADHSKWRTFFQETTGYEPDSEDDKRVFNTAVGPGPVTDVHLICANSIGEPALSLPASIRAFYGPPPKAVVKFRQFLAWCDLKFTQFYLRRMRPA